jgi:phosphatidylinositol glycan class M
VNSTITHRLSTTLDKLSVTALLSLSTAIHALFICIGLMQDAAAEAGTGVKYTDIDYEVFSDAARLVSQGESPYGRHTYRYTPLLAWLLVGNETLVRWWGKALFSVCDVVVGKLIADVTSSKKLAAVWLFSPIAIGVATRGSCDAVICLLMVLFLKNFDQARRFQDLAAIYLAVAVHYRLFPIVFGLPVLKRLGFIRVWRFVFVAGVVFLGLGALFWRMYGWPFLFETYLYHSTRRDHRHNFSLWFLPTYLSGGVSGAAALQVSGLAGAASVVVQMAAVTVVGLLDRPLSVVALLQTLVFVAFNRVITAQYFVWYGCLVPLALPHLRPQRWRVGLVAGVVWLVAKLNWLFWAFQLEMEGNDVFWHVHLASIAFFWTHIAVVCVFIEGTNNEASKAVTQSNTVEPNRARRKKNN